MSAVFFSLDPVRPGRLAGLCCPNCESPLTIHQPDAELPGRLLATCDECKSWFLAAGMTGRLVRLPDLPPQDDES